MQKKHLFTWTSPLLASRDYPFLICSNVVPGPEGTFGWCVVMDGMSKREQERIPCVLFTYDLDTGLITQTSTDLAYRASGNIDLCYEGSPDCWNVGINAQVRAFPEENDSYSVSIYDLYRIEQGMWSAPFRMPKRKGHHEELGLLTLWSPVAGERSQGLVLETWDLAVDARLFHYRCTADGEVQVQQLERGFRFAPFVFEQTFLIFCCGFRRKTAQWGWKVTAYQDTGSRLKRTRIPDITYQSRHEVPYTIDDFRDWLQEKFFVSQGPVVKETGVQTCVAAIFLQEHVSKRRQDNTAENMPAPEVSACQGGLYCFDAYGRIVSKDVSPLGEQIHLCLCDEEIIGTDRWNTQFRLWSWSPLQRKKREIRATFSSTVTRVSLVGMAPGADQRAGHFWSVEEDPTGITVSLWRREAFEIQEQMRVDNVFLPTHASRAALDKRPCGLWTYRGRLAVLMMDSDGCLQLVEFYPESSDAESLEGRAQIISNKHV